MVARTAIAVVVSIKRSKSLASLRLRPSQAKVRSITQPRLRLHSRGDRAERPRRAPRQQMEALGVAWPLDDLKPQALARRGAGGNLALVTGIGKQVPKPRETPSNPGADEPQAIAVLDVGGVNDQPQRQAQRIGEQMPLAAVDFLAGVEAARADRLGGLDTLAVDDRGGG